MSIDPVSRRVHEDARRRPERPFPTVEPTFFSRFECKYIVDPAIVPGMREFLEPFTVLDSYASSADGLRYPICSLYLDSPDLALYQQTVEGERDRFKLRVRTYSDDPAQPAFCEVKRKLNSVVHKRRAGIGRALVPQLLGGDGFDPARLRDDVRRDAEYFRYHVLLTDARPVIRIKYLREAYQATGNEPARITIDTDLMHAVTFDEELCHAFGRWTATRLDGVILEIKFTERFPWWIQELVREFGLAQRAVPKYVLSVDHMLLEGRESAMALGGVLLPPRRSA